MHDTYELSDRTCIHLKNTKTKKHSSKTNKVPYDI